MKERQDRNACAQHKNILWKIIPGKNASCGREEIEMTDLAPLGMAFDQSGMVNNPDVATSIFIRSFSSGALHL